MARRSQTLQGNKHLYSPIIQVFNEFSFLSVCVFFFLKLVSISRRCRPSELYIAVWLQVKKKKKGIQTWINPTAGSKPKMLWIMNCRQHFFYRCELLNWPAKWKLRQRTGWKDCRHVMSLEKNIFIASSMFLVYLIMYIVCFSKLFSIIVGSNWNHSDIETLWYRHM